MKKFLACALIVTIVISCRVSYGFRTASIDYTKTKTMSIRDFRNQASRVYPPLAQSFTEHLRDVFTRNTKLIFVNENQPADLELEGEITRYDLTPMAVQGDGFAGETRLTMAVRIRYLNNVQPGKDKEEIFSAYRDFKSDRLLEQVQDELIEQLNKEIVDQIFNATLSDW